MGFRIWEFQIVELTEKALAAAFSQFPNLKFRNWKFKIGNLLALCMALLTLSAGCSKLAAGAGDKAGKPTTKPVLVTLAPTSARAVPLTLKTFGNVQPNATVSVKAEVGGTLTKVHVERGQMVKKGDLLFSIDSRPFEAALKQAQANLEKDKAQLKNCEVELDREKALLDKKISSQSEYDKLVAALDTLKAQIKADEAAIDAAKLSVEYCTIRSPIDGRAGNTLVDQGNLILANDVSPLIVITQVQPVDVFFSVPQNELAAVREYRAKGKLTVQVSMPEENVCCETGELTFINNAIDETTGQVSMAATFANKEDRLWPGQHVNVTVQLTTLPEALVVPAKAVQAGRDGKFVFVARQDSTAEFRKVSVRRLEGEDFLLVDSGLKAGEIVVTDGQSGLKEGSALKARPEAQASSNPAMTQPTSGHKSRAQSAPAEKTGAGE